MLASVELEPGPGGAAVTAYLGYVRRNTLQWAWETGATLTRFSGVSGRDYGEVFGGLIAERWTGRIYFSPDYFGQDQQTIYAELNGGVPLMAALRATVHLGALARLGGSVPAGVERIRYDARIGLGLRMAGFDLRLAWVGAGPGEPYAVSYEHRRSTVVLGSSYEF